MSIGQSKNVIKYFESIRCGMEPRQKASEVKVNHPEVSFKRNLNSLRERLNGTPPSTWTNVYTPTRK
ncbi:hypothetical protein CFAM422_002682 [Trichoderma lentiforme]|uniref:Uncharacterized protein n=1 Tax=Trichoderma lentiforme TaxID=1567552 RepID=A0A9P5CF06_9HYPO|nr:hypothetical protein CFAM422_002682 [Trichoderma lentiforme]